VALPNVLSFTFFATRPAKLRNLTVPTLIIWGASDNLFPVTWSRWLANTIPGTKLRVDVPHARLYMPAEHAAEFNAELRILWQR
jgi:pimeloyl-ACP methyl ester carboxylesterase